MHVAISRCEVPLPVSFVAEKENPAQLAGSFVRRDVRASLSEKVAPDRAAGVLAPSAKGQESQPLLMTRGTV